MTVYSCEFNDYYDLDTRKGMGTFVDDHFSAFIEWIKRDAEKHGADTAALAANLFVEAMFDIYDCAGQIWDEFLDYVQNNLNEFECEIVEDKT